VIAANRLMAVRRRAAAGEKEDRCHYSMCEGVDMKYVRYVLVALIVIGGIQAVRHYTTFPHDARMWNTEMSDLGLILVGAVGVIIINSLKDNKTRR
jgi:hypothetical protein